MADEPQIELINDKWQNILPRYESNWFDLAIVDPPYGIGADNMVMGKGKNKKWQKDKGWDVETPDQEYFDELFRVSKKQIVWGGNYFTDYLNPTGGLIFWDKLRNKDVSFGDGEIAWTNFLNTIKKAPIQYDGFLGADDIRIHPTQKPVALYRWLLSKYANPGDTILDTHLGSGSSAIAAWQKKHDFVGIECDKDYFNDMLHRFKMNTNREYALEEWQEQSEKVGQQTIFSE